MSKFVRAHITFDLPADPREEAAALATVAAAWKQFSDAVEATPGIKLWGQSFEMKRARGPYPPRPHKPVLVA